MFIRSYLRASTNEQDATRAKDQLRAFAAERGLTVAAWYTENESGATLARPELFRLIGDAQPGDVLLVEQVDRRIFSSRWKGHRDSLVRVCARASVVAASDQNEWTARAESRRGYCMARIV
jgi:DNA invertase Pin-like site-specific DNA recombinase